MPAVSERSPGGTTKRMLWLLTDLRPHAAPLMLTETPLSSIGRVKLRVSEPTAVRGVTAGERALEKSTYANIPGATPTTADGVWGVGEGVGVAVGEGDGAGDGDTASRLAPVKKFIVAVPDEVASGWSR